MSIPKVLSAPRFRHVAEPMLLWSTLSAAPALFDLSGDSAAVLNAVAIGGQLIWIWILQRRSLLSEPIIFPSVTYLLAFPFPYLFLSYFSDPAWQSFSSWDFEMAAIWGYRAWCFLSIAYWVGRLVVPRTNSVICESFVSKRLSAYYELIGWIGAIGSVSFLIYSSGQTYVFVEPGSGGHSTIGQIIHYLFIQGYAYVLLYTHLRQTTVPTTRQRFLLWVILVGMTVYFVGSGSKVAPIALIINWLLGVGMTTMEGFTTRRQIVGAVAIVGFLFVMFAVSQSYREIVRLQTPPQEASIINHVVFQLESFAEAIGTLLQGQGSAGIQYGAIGTGMAVIAERLGYLFSLALIFNITSGDPPYENALEMLLAPLLAIVPRDVFGEKAHFFDAGDLAQLYGWDYGGISVTFVGSLFWSWGYFGICVGMTALGFLLARVTLAARPTSMSGGRAKVVLSYLVVAVCDPGGTFQSVVIDVIRLTLMVYFVAWLAEQVPNRRRTGTMHNAPDV